MTDTRKSTLYSNIVPASLSGCFTFLVSVTDGIVIGQGISTAALGGVNLAVPFFFLYLALFCIVSSGGGTIAAIHIGRNEPDKAQNVFMHSLFLSVLIGICVTVIGLLFSGQIAFLLGADQSYYGYTQTYIYWLSVFAIFESVSSCLQAFLRIDGYQKAVTAIYFFTAAINVILDLVMVFVYHKGVFGAAFATGISQMTGCLILLVFFVRKNGSFRFTRFSVDWKLFPEIIYRGTPGALVRFEVVLSLASFNLVLLKYVGPIGVDSFAIISYIGSLATEMFSGTADGLQPLLALSHGRQSKEDIRYYTGGCVKYTLALGTLLLLVCFALRRPLCLLFGATGETLLYSSGHLWQFCVGMPFAGVVFILSAYMYSTEKTKQSIVYNVLRSFIVNVFIIRLFPLLFAPGCILLAYPALQISLIIIGLGILYFSPIHEPKKV